MTTVEKIANDLKLNCVYVKKIVDRAIYYYKDYTIPKRNGGKRLISQPSPELKSFQYWVIENILRKLPVSQGAFAYQRGDSIKRHAGYHKNSKFIFHTDIKQFFKHIHFGLLDGVLKCHSDCITPLGLDLPDAIDTIHKICFRNHGLSIGAVSSPLISNIVLYEFDETMIRYCHDRGYKYSRYADDIYISSNQFFPKSILTFISMQLSYLGFDINYTKTWFKSTKYCRKVTGLVITNDGEISIGLKKRKEIKKMLYDALIHHTGDKNYIIGNLAFLKDIEPFTYDKLLIKYSKYCQGDVIEAIKNMHCLKKTTENTHCVPSSFATVLK